MDDTRHRPSDTREEGHHEEPWRRAVFARVCSCRGVGQIFKRGSLPFDQLLCSHDAAQCGFRFQTLLGRATNLTLPSLFDLLMPKPD
jgi:hypothetical protein